METLQLEHIVHYLPYRLQCRTFQHPEVPLELKGLTKYEGVFSLYSEFKSPYDRFKPILRPLSDLIKDEFTSQILINWGDDLSKKHEMKFLNEIIDEMKFSDYNNLRYDFIKFLCKNHFDVFGLIEKGLAIDINTL